MVGFISSWELALIVAVLLLLWWARWLLPLGRGKGGVDPNSVRLGEHFIVWVAQGFGAGRVPAAPGTIGSLAGLLWFFLLLRTGNLWAFLAGSVLGLALSVGLCGAAERILRQTDPPSVVLDEIAAMPICFSVWVGATWFRTQAMPSPEDFFTGRAWWPTLIVFALFRLLDVLKPWPIRQSQRLPGGWGVTADDVLAALGVALITLLFVA